MIVGGDDAYNNIPNEIRSLINMRNFYDAFSFRNRIIILFRKLYQNEKNKNTWHLEKLIIFRPISWFDFIIAIFHIINPATFTESFVHHWFTHNVTLFEMEIQIFFFCTRRKCVLGELIGYHYNCVEPTYVDWTSTSPESFYWHILREHGRNAFNDACFDTSQLPMNVR